MKTKILVLFLLVLPSLAWAGLGRPASIDQWVKENSELISLGKTLFFDPRLSKNNQISCATCHNPNLGFSDGLPKGKGVSGKLLERNAPHLFNLKPMAPMFWDGRAQGLAEQALGPIQNPDEMGLSLVELEQKIAKVPVYQKAFAKLFKNGVTAQNLAQAIAAFEQSLVSRNSAYDRYAEGDLRALSENQIRGLKLFEGKGRCSICHDGPNFTDNGFHNIGIVGDDPGRFKVNPIKISMGAFKTPGLRNIALSAPYMHDGSLATLEAVIEFYDHGGESKKNLDPEMSSLSLSRQEQQDLLAFLNALTDPIHLNPPSLP